MPFSISMIAACSKNRVIGVDSHLPWDIPEDMKYFVEKTKGQIVIMGRKTFESIGKPLPNRINVVVTRDPLFHVDGVIALHDINQLEETLQASGLVIEGKERIVMGGGEIYKLFLPICHRIYLTEVGVTLDGDAFFPALGDNWEEVSRKAGNNAANQVKYDFVVYERLTKG